MVRDGEVKKTRWADRAVIRVAMGTCGFSWTGSGQQVKVQYYKIQYCKGMCDLSYFHRCDTLFSWAKVGHPP